MLHINCFITVDGSPNVFTVHAETGNVSDLKNLIKQHQSPNLDHVAASSLTVWKLKDSNPIAAKPSKNLVGRIEALGGDLSEFADELEAVDSLLSIFPSQPPRSDIHVIVRDPRTTTITPSSSYKSNLSSSSHISNGSAAVLARLQQLHTHLWGKNQIICRETYSILDLAPFDPLCLNICWVKTLLVRDEYVLAYDHIRTDIAEKKKWDVTRRRRSATLVTGQPGIGKTLFLLYVLARRLHERGPVAFQINKDKYALFSQNGVTLHSTTYNVVPEGTWALSHSNTSRGYLCAAFQYPLFHVIHTSSPTSSRWKGWVKELGADKYIMDVWSLKELQTLLALCGLDLPRGKCLFEKYGPSPRKIVQILTKNVDSYEREVNAAAVVLASKPSALPDVDNLDFGDISSKIFTVRPKNNVLREEHILMIPTSFLSRTFGSAMCRQAASQQHTFFRMLKSYPAFCDAGGCLFEEYGHNRLSDPTRHPLEARGHDSVCHIPTPTKMIAGNTALKNIKESLGFYWRPATPNFEGVDAIIRFNNEVWALQYTIGRNHRAATNGLIKVREVMSPKHNGTWHLVMIGSDLTDAMVARDAQTLVGWKYPIQVYASVLPLGQFNERHAQQYETVLNDACAEEGSGYLINESL